MTEAGTEELHLTHEPGTGSRDIQRELDERLDAHNIEVTGFPFGGEIIFCVRDAHDVLRAGAYGWVWAGWFYLETLWVDADLRGQGWGGRLLRESEAEAVRRGATRALLETHDFQARPFYERHGYHVVAEVPDYPPGGAMYVMSKYLPAPGDSD